MVGVFRVSFNALRLTSAQSLVFHFRIYLQFPVDWKSAIISISLLSLHKVFIFWWFLLVILGILFFFDWYEPHFLHLQNIDNSVGFLVNLLWGCHWVNMLKALSSIPGTQLSLSEVGFQLGSFLPHWDAEPNAILLNIDSHHSFMKNKFCMILIVLYLVA